MFRRIPTKIECRSDTGSASAIVTFLDRLTGKGCQGPLGHAHGSIALLDEAMRLYWVSGHPVVAADIRLRFRQSLRPQVPEFHAWIEKASGRKIFTRAVLIDERGDRIADAEGLFMELWRRLEKMKQLFRSRRAIGKKRPRFRRNLNRTSLLGV